MSVLTLRSFHRWFFVACSLVVGWAGVPAGHASDHADPLDVPLPWEVLDNGQLSKKKQAELAGGLTDLFIFPVKADGEVLFVPPRDEYFRTDIDPAELDAMIPERRTLAMGMTKAEWEQYKTLDNPEHATERDALLVTVRGRRWELQKLTPEEKAQMDSFVLILCTNRDLRVPPPYQLEPYTYAIHVDQHSPVSFDQPEDQPARARYGGNILEPSKISEDVTITFHFTNDARMQGMPEFKGLDHPERITYFPNGEQSGIRDDPFIFPRFFKKNVVAAVFRIPLPCFRQAGGPENFLVWGTSTRDGKPVDHDGRSLRTQQPRFNVLNAYAPRDHVTVLKDRAAHPDLNSDLFLRLGFDAFFEYRPWDFVPDVVIYHPDFRTRFPNGRLLTDDVANLLSRNGDSLLLELSYKNGTWPRATRNDRPFLTNFPYLAEPWPWNETTPPPIGHAVSSGHKFLLIGGGLISAALLLLLGGLLGRCLAWRYRRDAYQ